MRLISASSEPAGTNRDGQLAAAGLGAGGRESSGGRVRRRGRWWLAALGALVVVAAGGWIVGQQVQSPEQAASEAAPPEPSWITAVVERRVLAQTLISRGDVHPQVAIGVAVPSSIEGSPVVTAVGAVAGESVDEGTRLVEVSGRPIFVLRGDVPVYRTLRPGMSGTDVAQLQRALARLGCDASGEDGSYGEATKLCVAKLYLDAGYQPIPGSETEAADLAAAEQALVDAEATVDTADLVLNNALGGPSDTELLAAETSLSAAKRDYDDAVASAESAVSDADESVDLAQAAFDQVLADPGATQSDIDTAAADVDTAQRALDEARRNGDSAISAAGDAVTLAQSALDELTADPDVALEYTALGQAITVRDRAHATLDALRSSTGPTVPLGEIVFAPSLPARVQAAVTVLGPVGTGSNEAASPGTEGTGGGDLATLAAGELVVSMTLRADQVALARVGMAVELFDERTSVTYPATITEIADTATTGTDAQSGHAVTITSDSPLPDGLSGVNLRVTITAASTETETLVVPLAAVSSGADGSTNVSLLTPNADEPTVVAVVTGLSADGFVAIEPVIAGTVDAGDLVVTGR